MALSKIVRDSLSTGIDDNSDATAITIDSSEKVGIGDTSPLGNKVHIRTAGSATSVNGDAGLVLESDDSTRCDLQFMGPDGAFQSIYFGDVSDDNRGIIAYSHSGNNMRFTVDASERMRLTANGLTFNGDTAAANALDDYEQGTWTPSIGGSATYNNGNDGRYVKVGGIVHCTFLANINSRGTGSEYRLSGLPFASQNTGFVHSGCVSYFANLNSNVTFVGFYVESNATTMQFVCATGSAGPTIAGNGFSVFKNSTVVYGAVSYPTDA